MQLQITKSFASYILIQKVTLRSPLLEEDSDNEAVMMVTMMTTAMIELTEIMLKVHPVRNYRPV